MPSTLGATKSQTLPKSLDSDLSPLLGRWGGYWRAPIYSAIDLLSLTSERRKGTSARLANGLRFERNVYRALLQRNFTENLSAFQSIGNATVAFDLAPNATLPLRCVSQIINNPIINNQAINNQTIDKSKYLILFNPKFGYKKSSQFHFCYPDILIFCPRLNSISSISLPDNLSVSSIFSILSFYQFIICIEIKLTYVDIAFEKLKNLYLPIVSQTFNLPSIPLVCVKNLTQNSSKSASTLSKAVKLKIPLLTYLGHGPIF